VKMRNLAYRKLCPNLSTSMNYATTLQSKVTHFFLLLSNMG